MQTSPAQPRIVALIPCAGAGSRAGTAQPKQYQPVAGTPLLWHTVAAFAACPQIAQITLVLAPDDETFAQLPWPAGLDKNRIHIARAGGASRGISVRNGLRHVLDRGSAHADDWVLVHDAARCLITPELIGQLIAACLPDAVGGLLAVPLADTLKAAQPGQPAPRVAQTLPRNDKWLAQTPQMFRFGQLLAALDAGLAEAPESITDEASAMERLGHAPLLVPGSGMNVKVTYPQDFALAEAVLRMRSRSGPEAV